MREQKKSLNSRFFIMLGLMIVLIGNIPFFILRGGIVFPMRDQLDGEIVAYTLGGKYLFAGTSFYPEYMGGVQSTALVPPSYLAVLFFSFFSPLTAFILNNMFVMIFAFLGMYLWGKKLSGKDLISAVVGLLFAFLPFYPVYGLSMAGIPLVAWALYVLLDKKESIGKCILAFLAIVLYGYASSLVLSGYAVITLAFVALVCIIVARKKAGCVSILRYISGLAVLMCVYIFENNNLIMQVLGMSDGYVSNKTEYFRAAQPFFDTFKDVLLHGVLLENMHGAILVEILVILVIFAVTMALRRGKKDESAAGDSFIIKLLILTLTGILISLFAAFYRLPIVCDILNKSEGTLHAFQADRFTWLLPFIWYSSLVMILSYPASTIKKKAAAVFAVILFLVPCAYTVLMGSTFKENAMELVRKESNALNWDAFFCKEEFSEVADYIEINYGEKQSEYRVGCLGIEPSVAIINGFYTIDGYSNNYDVEYKHRFRKIIAKELEKNEYNKTYFDSWGNRCYLFSAEYYGNEFLSKYVHPHFDNLELDTAALKELGCSYILAAGEIVEADNKGYELLNVFDKSEWTYYVYLYRVK